MNTLERSLLTVALAAERSFARLRPSDREANVIEPYIGHANSDEWILRGRVHHNLRESKARYGQSRLRNVSQMLGRFLTSEVAGARVHSGGYSAVTDEEGYFELRRPREGQSGWETFDLTLDDGRSATTCSAFAAAPTGDALIISDVDDTMMRTGAYSLTKNLWTSFTGNELTRQVFADSAVLMDRLHAGGQRPVYYVSSSPWNLYGFLRTIFERSSLVKGPMFLRDLGLGENKLITDGHGNHKGGAINEILSANPERTAILIGDTGQQDAKIYGDVAARHGGRIAAIVLREPGRGADMRDREAMARLREMGIPLFHGPTFAGMDADILAAIGTKAAATVATTTDTPMGGRAHMGGARRTA